MQIAVCDDLRNEREQLVAMVSEFLSGESIAAEINEYESGETFLSEFSNGKFALVFLDIYMNGISGIETARKLRKSDSDCAVIFTTTSREHGAEAFDIEAFHYLVKPIEKDKLFIVLEKWYNALCELKTVSLKCGRTEREILIRDILYVEVLGRNSTVHTLTEILDTQLSLAAIESLLPKDEFYRSIRYCLVSLRHIKKINEESILLSDDGEIPLSRRERDNLRNKLVSFRLRQLRRR